MRRVLLTVPTTGLLAGLLLLQADPSRAEARLSAVEGAAAQQQAAAADTVPESGAATTPPGASPDTTDRDMPSVVEVSAGGLSTITGSVVSTSSSDPVNSAIVSLRRQDRPEANGLRIETDDHGRFRFEGIPSGDYLLSTHHIGYTDRLDTIAVGHEALVSLDVPVTTQAVELPPIRVEVRSTWLAETGFYWRKERGMGRFVTPEEVERRSAHNFAGLMQGVQGVEVIRVCGAGEYPCPQILRMRQTNDIRSCRVKYFMDGQPMTGRVIPSDISAHDIAAVEIYRNVSEMPAQFYSRCGSVVLWTKRFDPYSGNP